MKPNLFSKVFALIIISLILSGCIKIPRPGNPIVSNNDQSDNSQITTNPDGTTTDPDGFVRFPIEPTRHTTTYVILEDICTQFSQKFMEKMIGKTIVKLEPPVVTGLYNCSYYFNDKNYLMLRLEYLSAEDMKKGHEMLGRQVKSDPSIPMKNYIIYQENGQINETYLILSDNKFLSFDRSTVDAMTNDEVLAFARRLATKVKDMQ